VSTPEKDYQEIYFPESSFGGFSDVDGTVAFYSRVHALLNPASVVLDFGCGRGLSEEDPVPFRRNLRVLKGRVARVVGVDVDVAGRENTVIDEFRPLSVGDPWPIEDRSVDLVLCDCVVEHLPDPGSFFQEARRVLKSGGYLCIRTTNMYSYVGLASRLVPNRLHGRVARKAGKDRKEADYFPTLYRCNSIGVMRRHLANNGFRGVVYGYEAEPRYLGFSRLAYALGTFHQKFAPKFLKAAIFAFARLQ
jgi:SAM-dependent methyltransferase